MPKWTRSRKDRLRDFRRRMDSRSWDEREHRGLDEQPFLSHYTRFTCNCIACTTKTDSRSSTARRKERLREAMA